MTGIRCTGDTAKLAEKLAATPAIDYVVLAAGSFDMIAEVVCEDDDGLLDLLNTKIRAVQGDLDGDARLPQTHRAAI